MMEMASNVVLYLDRLLLMVVHIVLTSNQHAIDLAHTQTCPGRTRVYSYSTCYRLACCPHFVLCGDLVIYG